MFDSTKLINAMSSHTAQMVSEVIDKVGKTSLVAGPTTMVADVVTNGSDLTTYAAMISMVGGIVWIGKILFDCYISWLKYKRGD